MSTPPPGPLSGPVRHSVLGVPEHRHWTEVKRSRFLTVLRRCQTEEQARALVAELRREFHDARHHCSAFVLGPDRQLRRSSDDGEPSGTAGIPMLDALTGAVPASTGEPVSDTAAVVVRWFGGVLLGAGGLVRAYSDAVSQAVADAPWSLHQRQETFLLEAEHATAGRWENELRSHGVLVLGTRWAAGGSELELAAPPGQAEELADLVRSLTAGRGALRPDGERWVTTP